MNLKKLVIQINIDFQLNLDDVKQRQLELSWSQNLPEGLDFSEEFYKVFLKVCEDEYIRKPTIIQVKKALNAFNKPKPFKFEEPVVRNLSCPECAGFKIKVIRENNKIKGFKYIEVNGKQVPEKCEC